MKFRTTIILLIIAAIGAAYIFLYDRKQFRTEEWVQRQQMVLPDYRIDQINKIELKKEKSTIVLESTDNVRWRMLQPLQLRADGAEVKKILSQFEFLRKVGTIKEGEAANFSLGNYGLDKPQIVVNLWMKESPILKGAEETTGAESKYTINIGDRLAAGQSTVYINIEGSKDVVVVTAEFLEKIDKNINDLRNKWAFEYDIDAVERIRIQSGSKDPIVCSRADQHWWVTQPVSDRGDTSRIRDILSEMKNLKIAKADYVSDKEEDIARYGLDKPRLTISIGSTEGIVQSLFLGHGLDDKIYAKRDDESSIFFVHDVVLSDLDLEPNDLRDKLLLRFDSIGTYGIEKVELEYPDTTLTMVKTKQYDWLITSPNKILADRDTIRKFIDKIKDLQIQLYEDDSGENFEEYGLGDSCVKVSVFRKIGEGETVKFMIGDSDPDGGLCYVKKDGEDAVYSVPTDEFYDVAKAGYVAFRDKLVLEFPKESAQEIAIDRDGKSFVCKKDDTGHITKWNLTSPVSMEADVDSVNQVVWNLSFLVVGKIIALSAEDLGVYGLDSPGLKVSVTYEKSGSVSGDIEKGDLARPKERVTRTLLVGGKLEPANEKSNYYAKFTDDDIIFQIGWPDVRDYSVDLVTMSLFNIDTLEVKSLKIKHPARELSFLKNSDNRWEIQPENKLLEGNFADRIISAMNSLKAASIVQYSGDDLIKYGLDNPLFSVTVGTGDGEDSLLVGREEGESSCFVMSKTTNFVYLMNKHKINDIIEESVSTEIQ
ncbi:MAG: hypothetical protein MAG551_01249 [Candidatus Scalindua arabica]|uniref:DUF4340 domain-containing protein n=1 Tax=Candidatus Scalindua arabica TaxID=1127984 RepID=A0A942A257_9BACT|nr:hypothetical protein [Candidatus Scalindua arabica]